MTAKFTMPKHVREMIRDEIIQPDEFYTDYSYHFQDVTSIVHTEHGYVVTRKNEWGEIAVDELPFYYEFSALI